MLLPFSKKDHCMKCETPFTWSLRRHHCRKCGDCICSGCSAKERQLVPGFTGAQRVCNACFQPDSNAPSESKLAGSLSETSATSTTPAAAPGKTEGDSVSISLASTQKGSDAKTEEVWTAQIDLPGEQTGSEATKRRIALSSLPEVCLEPYFPPMICNMILAYLGGARPASGELCYVLETSLPLTQHENVRCCAGPNGLLALASAKYVEVWDCFKGACLLAISGFVVSSLAFLDHLLFVGSEKNLTIWDLRHKSHQFTSSIPGDFACFTLLPRSRQLIVFQKTVISFWCVDSLAIVYSLELGPRARISEVSAISLDPFYVLAVKGGLRIGCQGNFYFTIVDGVRNVIALSNRRLAALRGSAALSIYNLPQCPSDQSLTLHDYFVGFHGPLFVELPNGEIAYEEGDIRVLNLTSRQTRPLALPREGIRVFGLCVLSNGLLAACVAKGGPAFSIEVWV